MELPKLTKIQTRLLAKIVTASMHINGSSYGWEINNMIDWVRGCINAIREITVKKYIKMEKN